MLIKKCIGYELEKEQSNTSEDFFNRSEITFVEEGEERTLYVLYVRYFEGFIKEFTPYEQDPIFTVEDKEIFFRDIVALICLLKDPALKNRKRLYLNSKQEFASVFENIDYQKLPEIFLTLKQKNSVVLRSASDYLLQRS